MTIRTLIECHHPSGPWRYFEPINKNSFEMCTFTVYKDDIKVDNHPTQPGIAIYINGEMIVGIWGFQLKEKPTNKIEIKALCGTTHQSDLDIPIEQEIESVKIRGKEYILKS